MTFKEALEELGRDFGSHRLAAKAHGFLPQSWNKMVNWGRNPSDTTLKKLGLERVVTYKWKGH